MYVFNSEFVLMKSISAHFNTDNTRGCYRCREVTVLQNVVFNLAIYVKIEGVYLLTQKFYILKYI